MLGIRIVFMAVCVAAGFHFRPFGVTPLSGAATGFLFGLAVILFELRLRHASLRRLIGAAIGSILGLLGAYLTSLILTHTIDAGEHAVVFQPGGISGDGLHRIDSGREQGRHAESAGARGLVRQRAQL